MQTITITLSDDRLAQLQQLAVRFGVQPEDLVRVSVEELLTRPEDAFQRAAHPLWPIGRCAEGHGVHVL